MNRKRNGGKPRAGSAFERSYLLRYHPEPGCSYYYAERPAVFLCASGLAMLFCFPPEIPEVWLTLSTLPRRGSYRIRNGETLHRQRLTFRAHPPLLLPDKAARYLKRLLSRYGDLYVSLSYPCG